MTIEELRAELERQAEDRPEAGQVMDEVRARGRRHRTQLSLLIAAAVVVMLTATFWLARSPGTQPAQIPAVTAPGSVWELQCAGNIDALSSPPADYTVAAGVVAINTALQTPNSHGDTNDLEFLAKSGLLIKTGEQFSIKVTGDSVGRAQLGWSNTAITPADSLLVPGCPAVPGGSGASSASSASGVPNPTRTDPADDQWLVYPGGIWVREPMCVQLTVSSSGQTQNIWIPIGQQCS